MYLYLSYMYTILYVIYIYLILVCNRLCRVCTHIYIYVYVYVYNIHLNVYTPGADHTYVNTQYVCTIRFFQYIFIYVYMYICVYVCVLCIHCNTVPYGLNYLISGTAKPHNPQSYFRSAGSTFGQIQLYLFAILAILGACDDGQGRS